MKFYNYFSLTIVVSVFFWLPDFSGDYDIFKRLGLIFLIYILINIVFKKIWDFIGVTYETDLRLKKLLSIVIGLILLGLAYQESNSKFHFFNDQQISTRDGYEDVGNDLVASGPDNGVILMYVIIGICFILSGVAKRDNTYDDKTNWDM